MKQWLTRKAIVYYLVGTLIVAAYILPFVVLGQDSPIPIHDVFDSNIANLSARYFLDQNNAVNEIPFMLGGLTTRGRTSVRLLTPWIYATFPTFWAYHLDDIIVRLVGFWGMLALLRSLRQDHNLIAGAVALAFAWLDFYVSAGFTVSGLPWVILAAKNLLTGKCHRWSLPAALVILGIYPFFSSLVSTGIFLLPGMVVVWAVHWWRAHKPGLWLAVGIFLMGCGYLGANFELITNTLSAHPIIWHRQEFASMPIPTVQLLRRTLRVMMYSHYHAPTHAFPFIWLALGGYLIRELYQRHKMKKTGQPEPTDMTIDTKHLPWMIAGMLFIVVAGVFYFLRYDTQFFNLREKFQWLAMLNLSRGYFFLPLVFYLMFYYALSSLRHARRWGTALAAALLVAQLVMNFSQADWIKYRGSTTYRQFAAVDLFNRAEQLIRRDRQDIWIGCLGFYPAIAHLNGWRTVGGYAALYPLEYKHRFRKVIAAELDKSPELQTYFDRWGSRCYLISSEIGQKFYVTKDCPVDRISNWQIDTQALKGLGTSYIFSAVEIQNHIRLHLEFLGKITDDHAAIDLYIYHVAS